MHARELFEISYLEDQNKSKKSEVPQTKITYLSLSTTPSIQAPNRITHDISLEKTLRKNTRIKITVCHV